jgi:methionyl-tRNA formyltransferase
MREAGACERIAAEAPDVVVVMAYGQYLPKRLLEIPEIACINLHASLLPRHRGASCIQGALDAGDAETGITVMHVAPKLDAGDIILSRAIPIRAEDTGGSLHDRLAELAPGVLAEALEQLAAGTAPRIPQDEEKATYIGKLGREDGRIDWSWPAARLERRIRAFDPWPGTFTTFRPSGGGEKRLKIHPPATVLETSGKPGEVLGVSGAGLVVACGEGSLCLESVQPDGSRRMTGEEFARGGRVATGQVLGDG